MSSNFLYLGRFFCLINCEGSIEISQRDQNKQIPGSDDQVRVIVYLQSERTSLIALLAIAANTGLVTR